ncbi:MAG: Abi family protein [Campylobacterota bacterium]|nr:Abi family protein [Campylobacterota bacterium]
MRTNQKKSYDKPFLNIEEQILKLKSRGMLFYDEEKAKQNLQHINYYRLSGYWLIYEQNHQSHKFKNNTYFEDILKTYIFDRELRLLFLEAIERIEVSIRTKFAYELSSKYGSHFHMQPSIFHCPIKYAQTIVKLKAEVNRSKETCVVHFKNTYKESLPPIWSSIELMTLGQTSNWFDNIQLRQDKQLVAKFYKLDEKVLSSFLHHLTIVRNISAHHSRLWNKRFTFGFTLPKYPNKLYSKFNIQKNKYIYNTIIMTNFILQVIDNGNNWLEKINNIIDKYNIEKERMGFKPTKYTDK